MKTLEPLVTLIECVSVSEGRPSKSLQTGWFKATDIYLFAPIPGAGVLTLRRRSGRASSKTPSRFPPCRLAPRNGLEDADLDRSGTWILIKVRDFCADVQNGADESLLSCVL